MSRRSLGTGLLLAALLAAGGCSRRGGGEPPPRRYLAVQAPASASPRALSALASGRAAPAGTRIVVFSRGQPGRVLSEGFDAAAWPAVSPDAGHVAFAARRAPGEDLRLYTMALGTPAAAAQPFGTGPGGCSAPAWLPDGALVARCRAPGLQAHTPDPGGLYVFTDAGKPGERITFDLHTAGPPTVLSDGRLIYPRERFDPKPGPGEMPRSALVEVNSDGTGATSLLGFASDPPRKWRPRAGHGDDLLLLGCAGLIADEQRGHLRRVDLRRPHLGAKPLRPDLPADILSVAPGFDGALLVTLRQDKAAPAAVFRLSPDGSEMPTLLLKEQGFTAVDAVALSPRPQPVRHASVVRPGKAAWLFLLDPYLGGGPGAGRAVAPGAYGRVRIVTADPAAPSVGGPGPDDLFAVRPLPAPPSPYADVGGETAGYERKVLGEAPLHRDGSILVQVPADRPLSLQLLTPAGERAGAMGAWFWVRPNERRGCVGCHEPPTRLPDNRPYAAFAHPPAKLEPGPFGAVPELPTPERGEPRD